MSHVYFKLPQAYRDLGIPFFLFLSPTAEEALRKHHVQETRRLHPDLLSLHASHDEREEQESKLAALNAAFLKLRDTSSRLDLVIDQILGDNPSLKDSEKPELPKALAMEYFELQEALEENPNDHATQSSLKAFHQALVAETDRLAREIDVLTGSFEARISDPIEISSPFVSKLLNLRNRQRYLDRLQADLEAKQR
ncbi:MAG: hypothetical protein ABIR96_10355 [Bdellovibrionota bacterium]